MVKAPVAVVAGKVLEEVEGVALEEDAVGDLDMAGVVVEAVVGVAVVEVVGEVLVVNKVVAVVRVATKLEEVLVLLSKL